MCHPCDFASDTPMVQPVQPLQPIHKLMQSENLYQAPSVRSENINIRNTNLKGLVIAETPYYGFVSKWNRGILFVVQTFRIPFSTEFSKCRWSKKGRKKIEKKIKGFPH